MKFINVCDTRAPKVQNTLPDIQIQVKDVIPNFHLFKYKM